MLRVPCRRPQNGRPHIRGVTGSAMVIVKLMGGLGNQFFQYAAGRCLAHRHGLEPVLDTAHFRVDPKRTYELNRWNIAGRIAELAEIRRYHRRFSLWKRLFLPLEIRKSPDQRRWFTEKRYFAYDPDFEALPAQVYLDGYWQNPRYFAAVRPLLLKELSRRDPWSEPAQKLLAEIRTSCSAAIHVRRGDYLSDPQVSSWYESCSERYYRTALQALKSRLGAVRFFVFSDDAEFARHAFPDQEFTIVDIPGADRSREEFSLMQACRHQIIANSSFSWWAAWLNDHPTKLVVAPTRWLKNPDFPATDLLDPSWITFEP